eukprot:scaffold10094_cov128-Isochrysis_galbana.AAC.5
MDVRGQQSEALALDLSWWGIGHALEKGECHILLEGLTEVLNTLNANPVPSDAVREAGSGF